MKQETAIATYKENPSSDLRTYLRRVSKNVVGGYISDHNETELIEFIKLGLMTKKAMQETHYRLQGITACRQLRLIS